MAKNSLAHYLSISTRFKLASWQHSDTLNTDVSDLNNEPPRSIYMQLVKNVGTCVCGRADMG